jgi:hypothetical protein
MYKYDDGLMKKDSSLMCSGGSVAESRRAAAQLGPRREQAQEEHGGLAAGAVARVRPSPRARAPPARRRGPGTHSFHYSYVYL